MRTAPKIIPTWMGRDLNIFNILLVVLFAASAFGSGKAPVGFRGVPWLTPKADVASKLGVRCKADTDLPTDVDMCESPFSIGDISVNSDLFFVKQKFVAAAIEFDPDQYETMKVLFIEKYGKPTFVKHWLISDPAGTPVENESLQWRFSKTLVVLMRHSNQFHMGLGSLGLSWWFDKVTNEKPPKDSF